ncbi:MAG TPA: sugar transferase [Gemmatimonadales bacterium]|nr:sugar transferase [Gemmatimonadales bacterium]
MVKRLLDVTFAAFGLVVAAPLLALAAVGIRLSSPGPVLYRARRAGRGGVPFLMYKLRTMHVEQGAHRSAITGSADPRVFPFGAFLRRTKLDELPQLVNVLRGDMSVIGPRPEDPQFVAVHYTPVHYETLEVRPGLASPGSLYSTTHGERLLRPEHAERDYVDRLLPLKLALDVVYVRRASPWYDAALTLRTVGIVAGRMAGRRTFPEPPEMPAARHLLAGPTAQALKGAVLSV